MPPAHIFPVGAVGEIIAAPPDAMHSYRVRFPDGAEASVRRRDLSIWNEYRTESAMGPEPLVDHDLLDRHVIYRCVVGSRAYGLEGPDSDVDRRGIYLPPATCTGRCTACRSSSRTTSGRSATGSCRSSCVLALKANPNVLECLWTPMVEHATPAGQELLAMRSAFLSQLVYQTFNGYVLSQFKKLEQDLRTKGDVRRKHVMHLVRLLLSGITLLREGTVVSARRGRIATG